MGQLRQKVNTFIFEQLPSGDLKIMFDPDHMDINLHIQTYWRNRARPKTPQIESWIRTGSDSHWDLNTGDKFGHLTEAPVLIYNPDLKPYKYIPYFRTHLAVLHLSMSLWYYEPYQVRDWFEEIVEHGFCVFKAYQLRKGAVPSIKDTINAAVVRIDNSTKMERLLESDERHHDKVVEMMGLVLDLVRLQKSLQE